MPAVTFLMAGVSSSSFPLAFWLICVARLPDATVGSPDSDPELCAKSESHGPSLLDDPLVDYAARVRPDPYLKPAWAACGGEGERRTRARG